MIRVLIIANNKIDVSVIIVSEFKIWLSGMCEYTIVIIFGRSSARKMIVIINGYSLITVFPSLMMLFIMSFEPAYLAEYSVSLDEIVADITAAIMIIIEMYKSFVFTFPLNVLRLLILFLKLRLCLRRSMQIR